MKMRNKSFDRYIRQAAALALAVILALGAAGTALAAKTIYRDSNSDDVEKIPAVELELTARISTRGDGISVGIDTGKAGYVVDSYEVINTPDENWTSYDCPRVLIVLYADDGYTFKSASKKYIKLKGDVYRLVEAKRENGGTTLTLTIDLKPSGKFGVPIDPVWGAGGMAKWSGAYKAKRYEVALYRNGERVTTAETTKLSYNFAGNMREEGNYTFKVRTIADKGYTSNWVESVIYDEEKASQLSLQEQEEEGASVATPSGPGMKGGWQQDEKGRWYQNSDGTWPVKTWLEIDGSYFYFDENGYALTGQQTIDNQRYFLGADGAMKTGWIEDENGRWRYYGEDGAMWFSATTPDGYTVGEDGVRQ